MSAFAAGAGGAQLARKGIASQPQPRGGLLAVAAGVCQGRVEHGLRERFDQAVLDAVLEHTGGHRQQAAARLGLGRNTLTRKLGAARPRGKR